MTCQCSCFTDYFLTCCFTQVLNTSVWSKQHLSNTDFYWSLMYVFFTVVINDVIKQWSVSCKYSKDFLWSLKLSRCFFSYFGHSNLAGAFSSHLIDFHVNCNSLENKQIKNVHLCSTHGSFLRFRLQFNIWILSTDPKAERLYLALTLTKCCFWRDGLQLYSILSVKSCLHYQNMTVIYVQNDHIWTVT